MSAQTELAVVPPKETALQVYQVANGLDPYLKKIRDEIDAFVPDVTTRKGREAIASIAYKVARSKTALDNVGKDLVANLKEIPKKIDAERKRMRDTLDIWQEEVRRPLNEWQAAEDARVDGHNNAIAHLKLHTEALEGITAEDLADRITKVEAVALGEQWEEFEAEAARAKDDSLKVLRAALATRQQYEAEQAELARLRAEAEAREQKEREERIAREAAERARIEAEQKAQAEREAVQRRELEAKAAADRRELELKLQAEQAERAAAQAEASRIAAEQHAEQERQNAARRAEEAAEQARQDERRRADVAATEILRQQEAREADKAHKTKINRAALEAFVAGGMTEECAKQAITLIALRKIPNISIQY
ncbi:hypothetical protein HFV04_021640 [Pseudomonas sp. BIGb0427]|uniref:hypothetical protein n=1 Tax=Pseudomonas sp. BIGb0427 TaxID=2724470 RepID=UPI00169B9BA9|nr:hypothetical protein [Pseudomonas sp. BIGb0427]NLU60452.1 hypothetical protein [Pseudomonas sp. BIGb0427]QPG62106.1 hypothetical protein HFV04_021640 [Pseudomonas sp. BIGb0427]